MCIIGQNTDKTLQKFDATVIVLNQQHERHMVRDVVRAMPMFTALSWAAQSILFVMPLALLLNREMFAFLFSCDRREDSFDRRDNSFCEAAPRMAHTTADKGAQNPESWDFFF